MSKDAPISICLLSGGLDSSVALALALERAPGSVALALTLAYGQRAEAQEILAAAAIGRLLDVPVQVVELPFFGKLAGGALLDASRPLPRPDPAALDGDEAAAQAAAVWVPNRNGVFLAVAAAHAESLGAGQVLVGFNREEARTFPDNSEAYLEAASQALVFSTRNGVRIVSPTAALDKEAILREGVRLGIPLEVLWPCYEGGAEPCGLCESCQRFRRAARRAGVELNHPPFQTSA